MRKFSAGDLTARLHIRSRDYLQKETGTINESLDSIASKLTEQQKKIDELLGS